MSQSDPSHQDSEFTIKDTLNYLKDSGSEYFRAKAELASIEAKEAAQEGLNRGILVAKVIFIGLFSYILLLATLIGVGCKVLEGKLDSIEKLVGTWPIVTFGLFLIHLLFVFIFIDKLKNSTKKVLFFHTKSELIKDKQWLQQITPKKESKSS